MMVEDGQDKHTTVISVGPLPPPSHGAALVHQSVVEQLRLHGADVRVIDTSARCLRGPRYYCARFLIHLRALVVLLAVRSSGRRPSVYFTGAGGLGIWYQVPIAFTARLSGCRMMYHHHSFAYLHGRRLAVRALTLACGPRAAHIVLSQHMRERLHEHYPAVRTIAVCSNSTFMSRRDFHSPPERLGSTLRLGHLSNLMVEKGLEDVFSAYRELQATGRDVHLDLAGPFNSNRERLLFETLRKDFGEADVTYFGALTQAQVPSFLSSLDLFLFPSRYVNEAEPLVVLEALASGTPVMTSEVGCLGPALSGTGWSAGDRETFRSRLRQRVDEIGRLPTIERRPYLEKIAALQRARFGPPNLQAILEGLGL